jgi:hypothetical protein
MSDLNPVPVMYVDVNIENPWMILEQLQDSHHNIVHIAETTRLKLLQ